MGTDLRPEQRAEEKRLLAGALDALNQARAAAFQLERFYKSIPISRGRFQAARQVGLELNALKTEVADLADIAARVAPPAGEG
jgi:hypothetical protein